MILPDYVCSLVMEASTNQDKKYMASMDKHDVHQINGQAVQNLYDATIKRRSIDFGDIPDSKGDFEKCKYYESNKQCITVIEELLAKNRIQDDTVDVIKTAMSNMLRFKPQFTTGFRMKHEFVMLVYNSLAMAIVDATTMLIHSYTDYIISADTTFKLNTTSDKGRGQISVDSLRKFNDACKNGNMAEALRYMLDSGKQALTGADVIITGVIVAVLLSIIPVIRELIYFYYYSRVKISDYLAMQADFLEMNKLAVESSSRPPQERKQIVKKQAKLVSDMRKLSDKIMIDHVDTNDVVKKEIKNESSLFSLDNIDKQISKNKMNGNDIMIL